MGLENDDLDNEWKEIMKRDTSGPRDWSAYSPTEAEEAAEVHEILEATYDAQETREKSPGEVAIIVGLALAVLALAGRTFSLINLSTTVTIVCLVAAIGLSALWFFLYATTDDDDEGIRL